MSITLRYSGRLKDRGLLDKLAEDFSDIASANAWPVDRLGPDLPRSVGRKGVGTLAPPLALEGIKVVVHPQTDPLWLTFDKDGTLTRLGAHPLASVGSSGPSQGFGYLSQPAASIQTSIGGPELHRTVIGLLDYLKQAYMPDLQVSDETRYWDQRDEAELKRHMDARR